MKNLLTKAVSKIETVKYGKSLVQFVKFGIVGASNTLLSLAITYACIFVYYLLTKKTDTLILNIGTVLGYVVGVLNSFFWNNKYVFKGKQEQSNNKVLAKTFVCYGVTFVISTVLMNFLVIYCSVPEAIAPIPRLALTVPLNFIANKFWAFKDREK